MKENSPEEVPYDRFFSLVGKYARQFGDIFSLPVGVESRLHIEKLYTTEYRNGKVLDFGCSAAKQLQKVLKIGDDLYHTCDNDASGTFTYESVDDITAESLYDIIAADQVIEHLSFAEGIRVAIKLGAHVAPGGIFQISVPNTQHPTRFLSNPTHQTPWNYLNICALLDLGGLAPVYFFRCNKKPPPSRKDKRIVDTVCRVFRMDWCDTVYVGGKRT